MKKLVIAGVVVVCLAAAGVVLFLDNINSIVKKIIEKAGTAVVETAVTVSSVDISLSEGKAAINGLAIQNPKGFSNDKAIKFGELLAQIDIKSQAIQKIRVAAPVFLFEEKDGQTNFGVMQKTIAAKKKKATKGKKAAEEKTDPKKESAEGREIRIDLIEIEKAQVRLVSDKLEKEESLVMEKMILKNLRGTSDQVAQQVLAQITEKVIAYSARKLAQQKVGEEIEKRGGTEAKSLFDKVLGD